MFGGATQTTGLFGAAPAAAPAATGGLFGAAPAAAPAAGGLFGAPAATPAAAPAAGGLFGAAAPAATPAAGGLFGAAPAAATATATPAAGGLVGAAATPAATPFGAAPAATPFGAATPAAAPAAGGGLFGAPAQPAAGASNLFGAAAPGATGLFAGAGAATTPTAAAAGSPFGGFGAAGAGAGAGVPGAKTYSVAELNKNNDIAAQDVPGDTVAALVWSPTDVSLLATGSWDKQVRVYQAAPTGVALKLRQATAAPVLSAAWSEDGTRLFYGGADNSCYLLNLQTSQVLPVGQHAAPVLRVFAVPGQPLFGTAGADSTVKYWDLRAGTTPAAAALTVPLGGPASAVDARATMLAVSNFASPCTVACYDLRSPQQPTVQQESVLKQATCALALFSDLSGFAVASVEARCSLQYWNENPARQQPATGRRSFAFRCHRVDDRQAYSINDIHFHPKLPNVFATMGSDGVVSFWEKEARHRLRQFTKMPLSVSQGKFNADGSLFAYTPGYDWTHGADAAPKNGGVALFVHQVTQSEVTFTKKTSYR